MPHYIDVERLEGFLQSLTDAELQWLQNRIVRPNQSTEIWQDVGCLAESDLLTAETWFWERIIQADSPREAISRKKIWLIFMLLRYAGLRWVELSKVSWQHLDWQKPAIRVEGSHARLVPLAPAVAKRLQKVFDAPGGSLLLPISFDSSYIRRSMQTCSKMCNFGEGLLTVRGLRRSRGLELRKQGLPDPAVDAFLGRYTRYNQGTLNSADPKKIESLLTEYVQQTSPQKNTARNRILGKITKIQALGLIEILTLQSLGGIEIQALITARSRQKFAFKIGTMAEATVKAMQVQIATINSQISKQFTENMPQNVYQAEIISAKSDQISAEFIVRLASGEEFCAIHILKENDPILNFCQVKSKVDLFFSAKSVVMSNLAQIPAQIFGKY